MRRELVSWLLLALKWVPALLLLLVLDRYDWPNWVFFAAIAWPFLIHLLVGDVV